jgi:hypothetical protein
MQLTNFNRPVKFFELFFTFTSILFKPFLTFESIPYMSNMSNSVFNGFKIKNSCFFNSAIGCTETE